MFFRPGSLPPHDATAKCDKCEARLCSTFTYLRCWAVAFFLGTFHLTIAVNEVAYSLVGYAVYTDANKQRAQR